MPSNPAHFLADSSSSSETKAHKWVNSTFYFQCKQTTSTLLTTGVKTSRSPGPLPPSASPGCHLLCAPSCQLTYSPDFWKVSPWLLCSLSLPQLVTPSLLFKRGECNCSWLHALFPPPALRKPGILHFTTLIFRGTQSPCPSRPWESPD